MKKITIIFLLISLSVTLFAQQVDKDSAKANNVPDTTIIDIKNKTIIIIDRSGTLNAEIKDGINDAKKKEERKKQRGFETHWQGIEFGMNNYITPNQSFTLGEENQYLELEDSKSYEFNLNLAGVTIPIVKKRIALISGLGLSWNHYRFDRANIVINNDSSVLDFDTIVDLSYKKNQLNTTFLTAPLALEFHFPGGENDTWFLIGGYVGVKLGSNLKLISDDDNKEKIKEDFHLNTFRYGLRAMVGVNNFSIYGTYSLQPLFKKDEGPELYPITVGIALSFN
jgi:lipopolysaccharide assembly outer membrane protein LptD (OstA)